MVYGLRMRTVFPGLIAVCAAVWTSPAPAQDPPPSCAVSATNMGPEGKGDVSIGCTNISEALGSQLADIVNRIAQNRLDPQVVIAKLEEVGRLPDQNGPRTIADDQRQNIVKSLAGKAPQQVAIIAHPSVADAVDYARGFATALLQVGWQIEGQQIRRAAPKPLDATPGVAIFVRNPAAPPAKATQLRAALLAGNIAAPLLADPAIPAEGALLWIGRRPDSTPAEQPK